MLFKIIFANPAVRLYSVIHVGRETRVVVIKHSDKNTMIFRHSARAWMFEDLFTDLFTDIQIYFLAERRTSRIPLSGHPESFPKLCRNPFPRKAVL